MRSFVDYCTYRLRKPNVDWCVSLKIRLPAITLLVLVQGSGLGQRHFRQNVLEGIISFFHYKLQLYSNLKKKLTISWTSSNFEIWHLKDYSIYLSTPPSSLHSICSWLTHIKMIYFDFVVSLNISLRKQQISTTVGLSAGTVSNSIFRFWLRFLVHMCVCRRAY